MGIVVEKLEIIPTEEDLLKVKKDILRSFIKYTEVFQDYVITNGDKVFIDYHATINGVTFDGSDAKGFELQVGSNSFLKELEMGCIGMIIGDNKDIDVIFPQNYIKKELSGKKALFNVTVK